MKRDAPLLSLSFLKVPLTPIVAVKPLTSNPFSSTVDIRSETSMSILSVAEIVLPESEILPKRDVSNGESVPKIQAASIVL